MPRIMVRPINAVMFKVCPVIHSPKNTALAASSDADMIDSATRKRSYMNSSARNTSAAAAANTMASPRKAICCCWYSPPSV